MTGSGEAALREALREWRGSRGRKVDGVDVAPGCLHGVVLQNRVVEVSSDLAEIRTELAWIRRIILTAVIGAAFGTLLRMGGLIP